MKLCQYYLRTYIVVTLTWIRNNVLLATAFYIDRYTLQLVDPLLLCELRINIDVRLVLYI